MNLKLIRKFPGKDCIMGELYVNDQFECFTLEDIERPFKIAGVTAIPRGFYKIVITFSARFKKPLPLLLEVPDFDGVRIHSGNTSENTEGCILVGKIKKQNSIEESRLAFNTLFPKLELASQTEKIFIEITGDPAMPNA
jgi:hypothetical protein